MAEETIESLRARIEAARKRERDARAAAARLAREMSALNRRRETQRLCTLGRAWGAYADAHGRSDEMLAFLNNYISRQTDVDALDGSRWAVPNASYVPAPGWQSDD